jgi:hypothetical protein
VKSLLCLGREYRLPDESSYKSLSEAILSTKCPKSGHSSQLDFVLRPGRLSLYLAVPQPDDSRHRVTHDHYEYSALSRVWLTALWGATFANNEIDGLILDTRFKAIRQYHPAILLTIIHNVGFPLAFSFGRPESMELYDQCYTTVRDEVGIDITRYVLLSD